MSQPKIMVVDDQPINVQLLKRKLEREGMEVIPCHSGSEALKTIEDVKPDLILLDVMMPDIDGLEVCARMQQCENTRSIPIIFITAQTSKEGKIEGLGMGAVDYITKPIDLDETLARVQTQLRFVAINREVLALQRRLGEARQSATIGAVTQGIAHNLNNLLGIAIGYLDLIKVYHQKPDMVLKNLNSVNEAIGRIVTIVRQLNTLVGRHVVNILKASLQQVIEGSIERTSREYSVPASAITVGNPLGALAFDTNIEVLEDVLAKVLVNAWESYGDSPPLQRRITITTELKGEGPAAVIQFAILDSGMGVDPSIRERVFEPFISTKHTVGVGMGLSIARHSIRSLGGEIDLVQRPEGGTAAIITHPVERAATRHA